MEVLRNVDLSACTSIGIGGTGRVLYRPTSRDEVVSLMTELAGDRPVILGKGTNVVFGETVDRPIIHIAGGLAGETSRENGSALHLALGAGAVIAPYVQRAVMASYRGLEVCTGIPGTVGGCAVMNAGTREGSIGGAIEYVDVCAPGHGGVQRLGPDELAFGHRTSALLHSGKCVLEVGLELRRDDANTLKEFYVWKLGARAASKIEGRTCGSVFRNPPGDTAGRLIESAGLKGVRVGNLVVSEVHANYVVNLGGATATQFRELLDHIRSRVRETTGVELEEEVETID